MIFESLFQNDVTLRTPESLYNVAALVLQENLIDLDDLYVYVSHQSPFLLDATLLIWLLSM